MKIADLVGGILALVIGAIFFVSATNLPDFNVKMAGPAFFPELVAMAQIICAIALIAITVYSGYGKKAQADETAQGVNMKKILLAMILTVIYYQAMGYLGFFLSTALFAFALGLLTQTERRWLDAGLTSLGVTGVAYGVFAVLLKASMPVGSLFR